MPRYFYINQNDPTDIRSAEGTPPFTPGLPDGEYVPYAGSAPGPAITASGGLAVPSLTLMVAVVGNTITITPTASGNPAPEVTLTALTLNGVDVLGTQTGTGPWTYVVPDAAVAQTVAATAVAVNGVTPDATASATGVVPARPDAMAAPDIDVLSATRIRVTPATGTAENGASITQINAYYTVNGVASSPMLDVTSPFEIDVSSPGTVVIVETRAVNIKGESAAGATATATTWQLPATMDALTITPDVGSITIAATSPANLNGRPLNTNGYRYEIYDGTAALVATINRPDTSEHTVTGLTPGPGFTATVHARTDAGPGAASPLSNVVTVLTGETASVANFPRDQLIFDTGGATGANATTIPLPVITTGAADGASIEARAVHADTGAEVFGWQTVGVASGGTLSGAEMTVLANARRPHWMRVQVRPVGTAAAPGEMANRFGTGHVIAVWGQSEIQNLTIPFYNSGGTPYLTPVSMDEMVSFHWHDRQANGPANVQHEIVTDAGTTNTRFRAMANSAMATRPGEKFAFILQTQGTHSFTALVDDSNSSRVWTDDLAIHEQATGGGKVGFVTQSWYAAPMGLSSNIAEYWHQIATGETIAGVGIGPLPVTRVIDTGITFRIDHLLTELYDLSYTVLNVLEPHRFESTNAQANVPQARNLFRAMFENTTNAAWTATPGHPVLHYANGQPNIDGVTLTDTAHPRPGEGSRRYGVGIVQSALQAMGLATWAAPTIDNVYWEPAGAYVDLWSSAGPIRSNATPIVGVLVNGNRLDAVVVNDGGPSGNVTGALRVTSASLGAGAFTSSTLLEFAPLSTGLRTEAEIVDGWNRYPLVDVGAPGMPDGVPLANAPDPAILASTIVGVPNVSMTANTWYQIGLSGDGHPTPTQPYTFAIRAAVGSTTAFDTLMKDSGNKFVVQLRDTGQIQYGVAGPYPTATTATGIWTPNVMHDFVLSMDPGTGDFRIFVDGVGVVSMTGSPWTWDTLRIPRLFGADVAGDGITGTVESVKIWREYSATGAPASAPHKALEGDLASVVAAANDPQVCAIFVDGVRVTA